MRIHFIYATPALTGSPWNKVFARLRLHSQKCGGGIPLVRRTKPDFSRWPFSNPYSITSNLYSALSKRWEVLLYDFREMQRVRSGKDDIIIGHPHPDGNRIMNRAILGDVPARARIILQPFAINYPRQVIHLDTLIDRVDKFIAITGSYWFNKIGQSCFAHWQSKMTRCDMAIDTSYYPFVKRHFNPPGRRKFIFIGHDAEFKAVDLLSILFGLTEVKCVWIGYGRDFPNLDHRPRMTFTPSVVQALAEECDFFITMGLGDANPTTILEAMAWGFPVCATPTSGYDNISTFFTFDAMNMRHNLELIDMLQYMPGEELEKIAMENRKLVESHYNWENFIRTVIENIEKFV